MEAVDSKRGSQGFDDASNEGVEVRRGGVRAAVVSEMNLRSLRWRLLPFMTKCSLLS